MIDTVLDEMRQTVEDLHGGRATYVRSVHVTHALGSTTWEGDVAVFNIEAHESADCAFAWIDVASNSHVRRVSALRGGPIQTPADAVRMMLSQTSETHPNREGSDEHA